MKEECSGEDGNALFCGRECHQIRVLENENQELKCNLTLTQKRLKRTQDMLETSVMVIARSITRSMEDGGDDVSNIFLSYKSQKTGNN